MPGLNCLVTLDKGISANKLANIEKKADEYTAAISKKLPQISLTRTSHDDRILLVSAVQGSKGLVEKQVAGWSLYLELLHDDIDIDGLVQMLNEVASIELNESLLRDKWNSHFSRLKGNFFCFAIHPVKHILVFANDALARLPVYFFKQGELFFVGRDIGLGKALCPALQISQLKMALYQIFCYVPGGG